MATSVMHDQRAEHGNVRAGILTLLAEQPFSGYEIIGEIAKRTDGDLRLPIATIFPLLDKLSGEGLARLSEDDHGGRRERPYELTAAGRTYMAENAAELIPPWQVAPPAPAPRVGQPEAPRPAAPKAAEAPAPKKKERNAVTQLNTEEDAMTQFKAAMARLSTAVDQVAEVGTEQQLERATLLVTEGKRGLYRILADDEAEGV